MTGLFRENELPKCKPAPVDPISIGIDRGELDGDMTAVKVGPHRLYCGDAYRIRPMLGWFDCDCMDPPYDFDNKGGGQWRNKRTASHEIIAQGLDKGFDHRIINPNRCGQAVVFFHAQQRHDLEGYLKSKFHRNILMHWQKDNPAPHHNRSLLPDIEEFFIAWTEDGAKDYFLAWHRGHHPAGNEHHDFHRYVTAKVAASKIHGHPTVKPDKVMDKIMRNIAGQTVCDPFMGTGSTGTAAIRAGKIFTGIEHNPKHFETAVMRIEEAYDQRT